MNFYDDLEIITCCFRDNHTAQRLNLPFDGYYGVQFIVSGSVWLCVGEEKTETALGPVVFFSHPGAPYSYGSLPGQSREHLFVCFRGERARRYAESGLLPEKIGEKRFFPIGDAKRLVALFQRISEAMAHPGEQGHAQAVHAIEALLLAISETAADVAQRGMTSSIALLIDKISVNPGTHWDFQQEAKKLNVSLIHFRRLFQKCCGMAPMKFLIECRLRKARQLILATDMRIREVSEAVGFLDVFHFSRMFKKFTGESPLNYRRDYQG